MEPLNYSVDSVLQTSHEHQVYYKTHEHHVYYKHMSTMFIIKHMSTMFIIKKKLEISGQSLTFLEQNKRWYTWQGI